MKSKPEPRDVTLEYEIAKRAAQRYEPGWQPDLKDLMRSAYMHGYAQALLDRRDRAAEGKTAGKE